VDHKPHNSLETDVNEFLKSNNFITCSATYHDVMPTDAVKILQYRFDMTSLYIRGRADRIAIHKTIPITFEWECKTHINQKYKDLTIELLPLAHHISKVELGVDCLYIFRTDIAEGGFWANDLPEIRQIWMPPRKEYEKLRDLFKRIIENIYKTKKITESVVSGSGDPFLIIDKSVIVNLPDWRKLITDRINKDQ
jgi:hypothetical protein